MKSRSTTATPSPDPRTLAVATVAEWLNLVLGQLRDSLGEGQDRLEVGMTCRIRYMLLHRSAPSALDGASAVYLLLKLGFIEFVEGSARTWRIQPDGAVELEPLEEALLGETQQKPWGHESMADYLRQREEQLAVLQQTLRDVRTIDPGRSLAASEGLDALLDRVAHLVPPAWAIAPPLHEPAPAAG